MNRFYSTLFAGLILALPALLSGCLSGATNDLEDSADVTNETTSPLLTISENTTSTDSWCEWRFADPSNSSFVNGSEMSDGNDLNDPDFDGNSTDGGFNNNSNETNNDGNHSDSNNNTNDSQNGDTNNNSSWNSSADNETWFGNSSNESSGNSNSTNNESANVQLNDCLQRYSHFGLAPEIPIISTIAGEVIEFEKTEYCYMLVDDDISHRINGIRTCSEGVIITNCPNTNIINSTTDGFTSGSSFDCEHSIGLVNPLYHAFGSEVGFIMINSSVTAHALFRIYSVNLTH